MAQLGAAVIGARMGGSHIAGYQQNPNVAVQVLCDIQLETAQRVAKDQGVASVVTDYREAVSREDVDIVSVCSPDYFHREHTVAALEAGKHVLCEKPMALTIEDCKAMVDAAQANDRLLMVGQVGRFAPGFKRAKEILESGRIGELFFVESEYAHSYEKARGVGNWRVDPRREPVIGGGCHAVDLLRWVAGECLEVSAYANHKGLPDWPINDCTIATMKFEHDIIGKVFVSIGCRRPYTMRSVFYGTEGTIICDNTTSHIQVYATDMPELAFETIPVSLASHNVASEIEELVDAVLNDKPVPTDGVQGARTVATCVAIVASAKAGGQPVQVDKSI